GGGVPSGRGGYRAERRPLRRHGRQHVRPANARSPWDGGGSLRRILHLIPMLNFGGAARAAIATARECQRGAEAHASASIRPSLGPMTAEARNHGVEVLDAPKPDELLQAIGEADVTLVHLWNSPELHEVLESELPPCRLVVWTHVAGDTGPQVLPPEIFRGVS